MHAKEKSAGCKIFPAAEIGLTDHYLVIVKFRVGLVKVEKKLTPKLFDSAELKNEQQDKFQALYHADYNTSPIEKKLRGLQNAIVETAEAVLGKRTATREEWISEETWQLINEKNALKVKLESDAHETSKILFRNVHKQKARGVKR